jgi:outer membrane protein assembly factor BamB
MRTKLLAAALTVGSVLGWGADWLTTGADPQRTGWQKNEKLLNTTNVKNMTLLWSVKTDNQPRQMHSLFPPLVVEKVKTSAGTKEMALVAGVSDNIYAIDVAKGMIAWQKHFTSAYTDQAGGRGGGTLCPGGLTADPVIAPAATPGKYTIYVASWDGSLHQINLADGEDIAPPAKWMPPNGKPYGLNLVNGVIYTQTAQSCGGNPNYVYSYDLASKKASMWSDGSGGMWGYRGMAVGADGTAYTGTGDGMWNPENGLYGNGIIGVKINPTSKQLELVKYFAPGNADFLYKRDADVQTTPTIFTYKGKEYLVGTSKECRFWLLDTANFGGADHRSATYVSPHICNEYSTYDTGVWGALSNWVDARGTQWVLSPSWGPPASTYDTKGITMYGPVTHGATYAFKVEEKNGKVVLTHAWISRDMQYADPPVIANGIVFGYGSGEDRHQSTPDVPFGMQISYPNRIAASTHATLYALDGETGKELWSSGDTVKSWNHFSGLTVVNGRVYIGTFDGMLYCFGLRK